MTRSIRCFTAALVGAAACALTPSGAVAEPTRVAIVLDAPSQASDRQALQLEGELEALFGAEAVRAERRVVDLATGLGAVASSADFDAVVAVGPVGSLLLARDRSREPPKPRVAALDLESAFWEQAGGSGVSTIGLAPGLEAQLRRYERVVRFRRPAIVLDRSWKGEATRLSAWTSRIGRRLGLEISVVPADPVTDSTLAAIPKDADAVVLGPLLAMPDEELTRLIDGLTKQGLPSFSLLGREHVEAGALAGVRSYDDERARHRRAALALQRALRGDASAAPLLPLRAPETLHLNVATAARLGIEPSSSLLLRAILVGETETSETAADATPRSAFIGLAQVARRAVAGNRRLAAKRRELEASHQRTLQAVSHLLPQLGIGVTYRQVNEDAAEGFEGFLPERQVSGDVVVEQSIFDEKRWAELSIEEHLHRAEEFDRDVIELDVTLEALRAAIALLRARAVTGIERSEVLVSSENLGMARLRHEVGTAAEGEVLRWEAKLANDRQRVVLAESAQDAARFALNRLLLRPLEEGTALRPLALGETGFVFESPVTAPRLSGPVGARAFRDFMVEEALARAPELERLDALIEAQERALASRERAFWLPTLSAAGIVNSRFARGGAGSSGEAGARTNWLAVAQATLPIFTGGRRVFERREALAQVRALRLERRRSAEGIETEVRSRFRVASASHQSIALAGAAAAASEQSALLVRKAYARGAAHLVDVIDAQGAARRSALRATNAFHDFADARMGAERSSGRLYVVASEADREAFVTRLGSFLARPR